MRGMLYCLFDPRRSRTLFQRVSSPAIELSEFLRA